ncbi:MAG TPA: TolC family protein [Anaeromyxobacteraceae bacterium]|nr:TolC family protein [Anaeromyxobacteraceae bacterium]
MRTLAALFVSLALAGPARAERSLTLDDALTLARGKNRDLAAARERVVQADADVALALSKLMPTVGLKGSYVRNEKEVSLPLFGTLVTLQPLEVLSGSATVTVPLLVPPAYPGIAAARHGRAASGATLAATDAQVLLAVAQGYYAAAGADELLAARREATTVTTRTLEDARRRLDAGAASPVEVSRAELATVLAGQAVAEASDVRERTYRSLATLLQLPEPFSVAPAAYAVAAPAPIEELTARALRARPELRALQEAVEARAAQVAANDLRWAPAVAAFGTATTSSVAGLTGEKSAVAAGVQLEWALFDGGARIADRSRAASQRREAEVQLAQARDAIVDEISDRARGVETKRSALAAAERAKALAEQTLEAVRTQYGAGTATQIELLQAQDAVVGAGVALAQARFDLAVADLRLRRSTGEFPNREDAAR